MNADSAQAGAAFDDSLVAQITTLLNGETLANFNCNTVHIVSIKATENTEW